MGDQLKRMAAFFCPCCRGRELTFTEDEWCMRCAGCGEPFSGLGMDVAPLDVKPVLLSAREPKQIPVNLNDPVQCQLAAAAQVWETAEMVLGEKLRDALRGWPDVTDGDCQPDHIAEAGQQ